MLNNIIISNKESVLPPGKKFIFKKFFMSLCVFDDDFSKV